MYLPTLKDAPNETVGSVRKAAKLIMSRIRSPSDETKDETQDEEKFSDTLTEVGCSKEAIDLLCPKVEGALLTIDDVIQKRMEPKLNSLNSAIKAIETIFSKIPDLDEGEGDKTEAKFMQAAAS